MRFVRPAAIVALSILGPSGVFGQEAESVAVAVPPAIVAGNVTVGKNLEASAMVAINMRTPGTGVVVTVKSNDPSKLLLTTNPGEAGKESISVKIMQGYRGGAEFLVQGLTDSGTATFTASAPGFAPGSGTVTFAPSGIVISGRTRLGIPSFITTPKAGLTDIKVYSARLDDKSSVVELQPIAGGKTVDVKIASSNPAAGTTVDPVVKLHAGESMAVTQFKPAAPGNTTLAVNVPPGFSTPGQYVSLDVIVKAPGISLTEDLNIGKDLQSGASVGLGELAPEGGVEVTLTSSDPKLMLLSLSPTEVGTETIKVKVPAGGLGGKYYIQALSDTGSVAYTATAPGYVSHTGSIHLSPSGIIVTGPLSITEAGGLDKPGFISHLSAGKPTELLIYSAELDRITHRAKDITVCPVRGGFSVTIELKNADPSVGRVASSHVTIKGGSDTAMTEFMPLKEGSTLISVVTPQGFTASSNSASLTAFVKP